MIKSGELMIGDFVLVGETPRRVESVTKKKIGYHLNPQTDRRLYYARLKDVEPIPITPDFLRFNGFARNLCYWEYLIDNQNWIEFYKHENRLSRYWKGVDEWENRNNVRDMSFRCSGINYVHQLQHAVKMCYGDKTWKYEGV